MAVSLALLNAVEYDVGRNMTMELTTKEVIYNIVQETKDNKFGYTYEQMLEVAKAISQCQKSGRKIDAIKEVRRVTGLMLKESKDLVEAGLV